MPDPHYRSRLTPWCIVHYPHRQPPQIIARHRKRSDAEAQIQILRQLNPQQSYALVFDPPDFAPEIDAAEAVPIKAELGGF